MPTFSEPRKYQTDDGTVVRIRISDQAIAVAGNAEPAGALDDDNIWAFASNPGSRRKKALNARGLVLGRPVGTAPNVFVRRTFLPMLTEAAFDAVLIGAAISLNGNAYTVRDKINEA